MRATWRAAVAALCLRTVVAQISFCAPANSDVCFQIGIPASAQTAQSGDMYFQIKAPTSYAWVALGEGSGMVNSNIFVLYQDGYGNVTISSRYGVGYFEPLYDPKRAKLTLLAGSGVSAGEMVANVRCSNCHSWAGGTANFDGTTSFISAWMAGTFASTSLSATIDKHDMTSVFTTNLAGSTIAADSNPFLATTSTATNGTHSNGPPNSGVVAVGDSTPFQAKLSVHGIVMAVTFVALYPAGSFLMPVLGNWLVHASWQMFAFAAMWIGFGFGYVVAQDLSILYKQTHTIFGAIVCGMMTLQPIFGFLHHRQYAKEQRRGAFSYVHIFYGRALLIAGIVNGGLGLRLANASTSLITAYIVVSVITSLFYISGPLIKYYRSTRDKTTSDLFPVSSPASTYKPNGSPTHRMSGTPSVQGSYGYTNPPQRHRRSRGYDTNNTVNNNSSDSGVPYQPHQGWTNGPPHHSQDENPPRGHMPRQTVENEMQSGSAPLQPRDSPSQNMSLRNY